MIGCLHKGCNQSYHYTCAVVSSTSTYCTSISNVHLLLIVVVVPKACTVADRCVYRFDIQT